MKIAVVLSILGIALAGPVSASTPVITPDQLRAKIDKQARTIDKLRDQIADLKDERDAQDGVIEDQNATLTRLRARDPLDAILARDADGQWDAITAIYKDFPSLPPGVFCTYDKSTQTLGELGLSASTFTFYRWTGC